MIYLENLIEALRHLSNAEFQRRAWLASEGPVVSSFCEDVEQVFDDTGLSDVLNSGRRPPELDERTLSILKDLSLAVDQVDDSVAPELLLRDQNVERVRQLAARALAQLLQSRVAESPETPRRRSKRAD
jgi:hypothetical protein